MPPWLTLSTIKDAVVIIAILGLAWWLYHAGENAVRVKDVKGLQQQIARMQQTEEEWQREQHAANAIQASDLAAINSGSVVRPLHVELCPSDAAVKAVLPGTAAATGSPNANARGSDLSVKRDIGPAVRDYERWLETEFAECRAVIASWPSGSPATSR